MVFIELPDTEMTDHSAGGSLSEHFGSWVKAGCNVNAISGNRAQRIVFNRQTRYDRVFVFDPWSRAFALAKFCAYQLVSKRAVGGESQERGTGRNWYVLHLSKYRNFPSEL
jgi:hypothetical protein